MTEYITKEQAWDVVKIVARHGGVDSIINADKRLAAMPAADVVEVVRCKDCRHKQVDEIIFALSANPETALFCKRMGGIISETFYCAAGERMDGEDK